MLELHGRDVLAARCLEQRLLAVGDLEEPVLVDLADVAGREPAALEEDLLRLLLALVVALGDVRRAREDLAVRRDLELDAGDRAADADRPVRERARRAL